MPNCFISVSSSSIYAEPGEGSCPGCLIMAANVGSRSYARADLSILCQSLFGFRIALNRTQQRTATDVPLSSPQKDRTLTPSSGPHRVTLGDAVVKFCHGLSLTDRHEGAFRCAI